MKGLRIICAAFMTIHCIGSYAQRTISEGTIVYQISISSKSTLPKTNSALNGATTTMYLKGGLSRTEMSSSLGTETTIYNAKIGNAVILKEYSGQKLMITLTKENWEARNKKFEGVSYETGAETKVIEGYNCRKATAKLKDGSLVTVYYTVDLISMNKEYNQVFKELPGFPVEYEFETDKTIFNYHLSQIDFSPVPMAKFEFPKSGFRVMSYDENKRGNVEAL